METIQIILDFPGCTVDVGLPADAGDTGSILVREDPMNLNYSAAIRGTTTMRSSCTATRE